MIDTIKEIWQTLCTNKLRTFLTGFSVAWGIFMLILLLAIAKGLVNGTSYFSEQNDPNRLQVWGGRTSMPYKGLESGRKIELGQRDMAPVLLSDREHISHVTASMDLSGTVSTSSEYISTEVEGVYPEHFVGMFTLLSGRFINDADIRQQRKVMLLSKDSALSLFGEPDAALGKVVKFNGLGFTVIGVYDNGWGRSSYVPYSTAFALKGYPVSSINDIVVHFKEVDDVETAEKVEQNVREALAKTERFSADDRSAIWVHNRFKSYIESLRATGYLNTAMWVIGILTLITGIVGVSNIMFVSVRERTHEIGIRRAIGAKPRNILLQVILESVALTAAFGYIGIAMGTIAVEIVKHYMSDMEVLRNPGVDISIAIEVTIALVIAGALAGVFPAMRALKIKPVEALQEE